MKAGHEAEAKEALEGSAGVETMEGALEAGATVGEVHLVGLVAHAAETVIAEEAAVVAAGKASASRLHGCCRSNHD